MRCLRFSSCRSCKGSASVRPQLRLVRLPFVWIPALLAVTVVTGWSRVEARVLDLSESKFRRAAYRLVPAHVQSLKPHVRVLVTDLDQNGVSELLVYPSPAYMMNRGPARKSSFILLNLNGEILQEEPILGPAVPTGVLETDVLDAAGSELVIGYQKGKELRCRIWNYQSLVRKDFRLYTRRDSVATWDAVVLPSKALDVNLDGVKELLFMLRTGHGRMPRGWIVLNPRSGEIVQQAFFGGPPAPGNSLLTQDFDHDGHMELVFGTSAPENHVEVDGISDLWAYTLIYDLLTGQRELSKIMGPYYGDSWVLCTGPTPDTWVSAYRKFGGTVGNANSRLSLFRWRSTVPVKELNLPGYFDAAVGDDYDGDGLDDIYCVMRNPGQIWVVSRRLELIEKLQLRGYPMDAVPGMGVHIRCEDINADGHKEVVLDFAHHIFLLDSHLRPLAFVQSRQCRFRGPFFQGPGEAPLLVTEDAEAVGQRQVDFWKLEPTPVLVRYGPSRQALETGVVALVIGVVLFGYLTYRKTKRGYQLLNTSLGALRTQVISIDGNGQVVSVWGHRLLRLEPGKHIREACRERSLQSLVRVIEEWQKTGRLTRTDLSLLPSWANTPLHVLFEPVRGSNQLLLIVRTTEDATGLSREHWRGLARRLSHEIKNPLTTVNLTLQQLQSESMHSEPVGSERVQRGLARALAHAEHLRAAVQRFVKLANPAQRNLQRLELNAVLQQWASLKGPTLPEDIKLLIDVANGLPPVNVDADQIHEVLDNLLENAVNAMPEGGLVRVTTRVERAFQRDGDADARDYIIVEFKDSGKGIPPDLLGKIFEPGFTTSPGGTGMGMFIVRKIVEDHGGFIDVTSAVDLGTVVTIYLPADEEDGE